MTSVLFVCTGNMYRSPIAAETFRVLLFRDAKQNSWQVSSAGTWTTAGVPAPRDAMELARSFGINIDKHITRIVNRDIIEENDLILVMEESHKEALQVEFPFARDKIHLLSHVLYGSAYDIPDPARSRSETKAILEELVSMMRIGYSNIYKLAETQ